MTDSGVHSGYYFIKPLGSGQTEPLNLDFSYHLEYLCAQPRLDRTGEGAPVLERPKLIAVVDVKIRLSARWRAPPRRHCSAPHYAERRRDADPDSCRLSPLVCWQAPL